VRKGNSDLIDISVQLLRETERAVLVTASALDNKVWLPKSMIEIDEPDVKGIHTVTIPEWLARDKGLI